jgi:hypothetical protein
MAVWAYRCIPCGDPEHPRYVACDAVDDLAPGVRIVRLRTGSRWLCARLQRDRRIAVDGVVVRDVVASAAEDCSGCTDD